MRVKAIFSVTQLFDIITTYFKVEMKIEKKYFTYLLPYKNKLGYNEKYFKKLF